jgi:ribonuclease J
MSKLTFYGGVNEIGGNKILLEEGEHKLLLDFGFPYSKHKNYYEEYLKPRSGAGLLDPLEMGLLPTLRGIYRPDLETPTMWDRFKSAPFYRELDDVEGVLLTHAHLDHSGHIAFLKQDIPIYSTAITACITKAIQDSGKSDYDQQVCYYSRSSEPHGEEQEMDFRRLHNWLEHFKISKYGIPVQVNGGWEIPEGEKGLHASGHACGPDLLNIVREIKPEKLIPVHSEHPEYYAQNLNDNAINVIFPEIGKPIIV